MLAPSAMTIYLWYTLDAASLPLKYSDLGVRQVHSLALPAFLASVASTAEMLNSVLFHCLPTPAVPIHCLTRSYCSTWDATFGPLSPDLINPCGTDLVSEPDRPPFMPLYQLPVSRPHFSRQLLRIAVIGFWHWPMPISACGLKLSNDRGCSCAVAMRHGCVV
jgi:hypothetical protein